MIRVDQDTPTPLSTTSLESQGLHEEADLHKWFMHRPSFFLQEDLLIIGHEVQLGATGDRLDVLAIDRDGNLVVVELKREQLSSGVDFQGLNYVSHVAEWGYNNIEQQFDQFKRTAIGGEIHSEETTLEEELNSFCEEDSTPNTDQRLIYIGRKVRPRIGKIAQWLHKHGIDITVVRFDLYEDDGRLYLDSTQVIPAASELTSDTAAGPTNKPWKVDGEKWHTEKRTSPETARLLQKLVDEFRDFKEFEGPSWNQRYYVAFYKGREWRIKFVSRKTRIDVRLRLNELSREGVDVDSIADAAGVSEEDITLTDDGRLTLELACRDPVSTDVEALKEAVTEYM